LWFQFKTPVSNRLYGEKPHDLDHLENASAGLGRRPRRAGHGQRGASPRRPAPQAAPAVDESAQVEELVVTGFRSSLSKALDVKRDSIGAVDAIMAEDIAAFPTRTWPRPSSACRA
jgi:hypothetical protein